MATTFRSTPSGSVEIYQDGNRVSTGSADAARAQGYTGADTYQPTNYSASPVNVASLGLPVINPNQVAYAPQQDLSSFQAQLEALNTKTAEQSQYESGVRTAEELSRQLLGRGTAQANAEQDAGIVQKSQDVQALENEFNALVSAGQAVRKQYIADYSTGRRSTGAVSAAKQGELAGIQAQAYDVQANLQAAQGNLKLAQDLVNKKIELQFKPIEDALAAQYKNLELLSPLLTVAENKQAKKMEVLLAERERQIQVQKEVTKDINNLGLILRQNGAPDSAVSKVLSSKSYSEAIQNASGFLKDPMQELELRLKQAQIDEVNARITAINAKSGEAGSSDSQYNKEQFLSGKIAQIDNVINSAALNSVVGPSLFARGPGSFLEGLARVGGFTAAGATTGAAAGAPFAGVGAIPGGLIGTGVGLVAGLANVAPGTIDTLTGSRQNVIGDIEQLVSKEFIQSLIEAKAAGATFGALTEKEQDALTRAATKIGSWRMQQKVDGEVQILGYNAAEADMRRELNLIRDLAQKAYERSTGKYFSTSEDKFFSELEAPTFSPTF